MFSIYSSRLLCLFARIFCSPRTLSRPLPRTRPTISCSPPGTEAPGTFCCMFGGSSMRACLGGTLRGPGSMQWKRSVAVFQESHHLLFIFFVIFPVRVSGFLAWQWQRRRHTGGVRPPAEEARREGDQSGGRAAVHTDRKGGAEAGAHHSTAVVFCNSSSRWTTAVPCRYEG